MSNGQEGQGRWGHNPDTWLVLLTGLAIVTGFITGWIFYKQFREMRNQTGILKAQAEQAAKDSVAAAQQVERQLVIAGKQATAAQDSVKAIRRQMRQDQRPWVDLRVNASVGSNTSSYSNLHIAENQPLTVPLRIINTGKTAALALSTKVFVEVVHNGQDPKLNLRDKNGFLDTSGILVPNSAYDFVAARTKPEKNSLGFAPVVVSRTEQDDLLAGRAYVAVYGIVNYKDIFDVFHWTKTCFWIPFSSAAVAYSARKCTDYNSLDSN